MTEIVDHKPVPFNPNDAGEGETWGAKLPVLADILNSTDYATAFCQQVESAGSPAGWTTALMKALGLRAAPVNQPYSRIASLPDPAHDGVFERPGIPPIALQKLVRDHTSLQAIIGMRCDDVQRYSSLSKHPWKPGWGITLKEGLVTPSKKDRADIQEAEAFLQNCNAETGTDVRKRDALGYNNFQTFLGTLARESLTYDAMPIWTDMVGGKVRAFKCLSATNIRLTLGGYKGNPALFAVVVDEANNVRDAYTRDQLVYAVRNPRADPDVQAYGWSEVEMAMTLAQGFTNAMEMNLDTFNRNATPHGILLASGNWMQKQLDVLSRIWANLKRGTSKTFALPAISVPKDGKLELLDFSRLKSNDAYYKDLMNMLAGLLCALYRFPVNRLGYKISGGGSDSQPNPATSGGTIVDEDDPGRAPFLQHIETVVNEYLIWSRWPHLTFRFFGKNPKEDAREYEARMNAMTWGERRKVADLPDLKIDAPKEFKDVAELLEMCPTDSGLAGVFQAVVSAKLGGNAEGGGEGGARFPAKTDPAKSEAHGHTSGVRRDSAKEKSSTEE